MAKQVIGKYTPKPHKKRRGIHAKTKMSFNSGADNYVKKYVGQGGQH